MKLKPGQKGTKKLVELYGSRLVCVRYRYDEGRQKRFKTAEIIVEEVPWVPVPKQTKPPTQADVQIAWGETQLAQQVKAAGGKWNRAKRLWEMPYDQAIVLGLEARIQTEKASDTRNQPDVPSGRKASDTRNQKASNSR
ncbi:MAG TPA: hypothetical protein VEF04_00325 [Blastocatellia bacterium]|nr:hypothetical protein [Blastocatellia bacterium]